MSGPLAALTVLAVDTTPEDSQVSPGLIGFLATFAVAVVVVLLLLDLVRRLRRLKYREELALREQAEADAAAGTVPDDTSEQAVRDTAAHTEDDTDATAPEGTPEGSPGGSPGGRDELRR